MELLARRVAIPRANSWQGGRGTVYLGTRLREKKKNFHKFFMERKVETCRLKHHCVYPNMTAGATHVYMC